MLRAVRSLIGAAFRAVRNLPDRLLHRRRRERARRRLRDRLPPRTVLFVCTGNICRSPFAEHVFRDAVDGEGTWAGGPPRPRREVPVVTSAGFIRPGRPSPPEMRRAARRRGVRLADHRSRPLSPPLVDRADLVVVMDPRHRARLEERFPGLSAPVVLLGDLDPEPIRRRAIRDPWGDPPEVFGRVADRVQRCVRELARVLSETVPEREAVERGAGAPEGSVRAET